MRPGGRPNRRDVVHRHPAPRSSPAISALPSLACHGIAPRPTGRRRPTASSARPLATSATIVATPPAAATIGVQHADVVGGGRLQPGVHGGAVARRGSRTTVAPAADATAAVASVLPLSTTIAR